MEYTYEDFPASKARAEGMKDIAISRKTMGAFYRNDIVYINRSGIDLTLQMLIPEYADGTQEKYPCIAFIQGSGWTKQDVYFNLPQMVSFAKRGYVVASIEYRASAVAALPAQVHDVKTAIRFLRKNADEYKIDTNNFFIWGDSSGAHCALLAGMTDGVNGLDTDDYGDYSIDANAIVDIYGPTDFVRLAQMFSAMDHSKADSPEGLVLGGVDILSETELAKKYSPITYVSKEREIPPVFIIHGDKDRVVPFEQSTEFADKLNECGKEYLFYRLEGADHGGPQFWHEDVLDIIDSFLKKHMK